jgi:rhamnosyltransferase
MLNICAVMVTYEPESKILLKNLLSIQSQVKMVVIVDNSLVIDIKQLVESLDTSKIYIIKNNANLGIATAQNIGIRWARENEFSYVLLLDQDSCALPDMVKILYDTYTDLISKKIKVAAVGPIHYDERKKTRELVVKNINNTYQFIACNSNQVFNVDILISSGLLIPISVLDNVGLMEESFFIDQVDHEWIFRAQSYGYQVFVNGDAMMNHTIGAKIKRYSICWYSKEVIVHSPFRYYFMFRNSILLSRRGYVKLAWKKFHFSRLLKQFIFFLLFVPNRRNRIKMIFKGIFDGIIGKTGAIK